VGTVPATLRLGPWSVLSPIGTQVFIDFREFFGRSPEHAYRWVDLERFRLIRPAPGDRRILEALIEDDHQAAGVPEHE